MFLELQRTSKFLQTLLCMTYLQELLWGKSSLSLFMFAPIAQLDRALDYESRGRGFESSWA